MPLKPKTIEVIDATEQEGNGESCTFHFNHGIALPSFMDFSRDKAFSGPTHMIRRRPGSECRPCRTPPKGTFAEVSTDKSLGTRTMFHVHPARSGASTIPIALVYPNRPQVGWANLGFQFVLNYLQSHGGFTAEPFFARSEAAPVSETSRRRLNDFPIIAFSVPFENDYPTVIEMLMRSGIPPLRDARKGRGPLIIAGGVSVSMNPEPLAPFLDAVHVGELDSELPTLFDFLARNSCGFSGDLLREAAATIPGAYIPEAYSFRFDENSRVSLIEPDKGFPLPVDAVKRRGHGAEVPVSIMFDPDSEFGEMTLLEVNRGCGRGCNYCAGGWIHHPVRRTGLETLRPHIDEALRHGRPVGLIGSDLAGHPELEHILAYIVDREGKFSLSSIRPEGLSPTVIKFLARTGQRTATLAPETASERMKEVIGKPIPNQRFLELTEQMVDAGIPSIRFYFMIGLPTETDHDIDEMADFIHRAQEVFVQASRARGRIGEIGVQVNPFVPKPWTPFQWAVMERKKNLETRAKLLSRKLNRLPNLKLRIESPRYASIQGLFSRGDRRMASLLTKAAESGLKASLMRDPEADPERTLYSERAGDELFPWDVTGHGIGKSVLYKRYLAAMNRRLD